MKLIKINYLTYYFLIIFFLCGLIKNGIIVFLIVFVHEMGHVVASKINKYKIINVTIYPFGGITKLEKDINSPLKKDFFLAVNGILFQIILFIIFYKINDIGLISNKTFNIFNVYNNLIMIFNLLPIEPLDGSKISEIIFSKFFSYKKCLYLNLFLSIITFILFFVYTYTYSLNNYMIICFLIFKILEQKKNINLLYNKFLMERYLKNYEFKKIKNEKNLNISVLQKNIYHYFWDKNTWLNEKKVILKSLKKEI